MLVVNLAGAPGAGKSTGAAYIFSKLKMKGINAELVTEYAKDKVWEEDKAVFDNQVYIFGKQLFRLTRLEGKVDVVITDSPIILSLIYNNDRERLGDEFDALVKKVNNSFTQLNYFIKRVKPYNPKGRFQTEDESDKLSHKILCCLNANSDWPVQTINGDTEGYDKVISDVEIKLHLKNLRDNWCQ